MSATKRRVPRYSSMEVLGFAETAATTYDSRLTWVETAETAVVSPAPTPDPEDPLFSWLPSDWSAAFTGRKIRWGMVATIGLLLLFIVTAAVWVYQRPAVEQARARESVVAALEGIQPGLVELGEANATLAATTIDGAGASTATLAVDSGVRSVFDAAGALTDADSDARTRIISVSGSVAEAARRFGDAVAVRSAVIPALTPPDLITDPSAVSLEDAAAGFANWQARYESIRETLPEATFREVSEAIAALSANLTGHQSLYLDALSEGDEATASGVVDRITGELEDIEAALMEALADTKSQVDTAITDAQAAFAELIELLG